jgi:exodeoxyribonuclease V gamma subunit
VRAFLRRRLGISLWDGTDEIEDALRIELDPLERWDVGRRLLEARLTGVDATTTIRAEIARGDLPPNQLGRRVIDDVYPRVKDIVDRAEAVIEPGTPPDTLEVRVRLGDGRLLSGTVAGVRGHVLLSTAYSRIAAKHRLAAWVRLLALTASRPERELSAATVGRGEGDDVRVALIEPLSGDPSSRAAMALAELNTLVDLWDRGMREPLPLICATSAAYAEAARGGRDPLPDAEAKWTSEWSFDREDRELEHQLAFGGVRTFDELLDEPPRSGESGDGWHDEETTRLGRLARRLWDPLLTQEEVSSR